MVIQRNSLSLKIRLLSNTLLYTCTYIWLHEISYAGMFFFNLEFKKFIQILMLLEC